MIKREDDGTSRIFLYITISNFKGSNIDSEITIILNTTATLYSFQIMLTTDTLTSKFRQTSNSFLFFSKALLLLLLLRQLDWH